MCLLLWVYWAAYSSALIFKIFYLRIFLLFLKFFSASFFSLSFWIPIACLLHYLALFSMSLKFYSPPHPPPPQIFFFLHLSLNSFYCSAFKFTERFFWYLLPALKAPEEKIHLFSVFEYAFGFCYYFWFSWVLSVVPFTYPSFPSTPWP